MYNFEKFIGKFPDKNKFYSSLSDKGISDKEYEHGLKVWNKFEIKMMKDYHGLFLKFNVLLLADTFKKLGNRCQKNCGFCPSHFLSAPVLSWDAMLNMTKIKLHLISNVHKLF